MYKYIKIVNNIDFTKVPLKICLKEMNKLMKKFIEIIKNKVFKQKLLICLLGSNDLRNSFLA